MSEACATWHLLKWLLLDPWSTPPPDNLYDFWHKDARTTKTTTTYTGQHAQEFTVFQCCSLSHVKDAPCSWWEWTHSLSWTRSKRINVVLHIHLTPWSRCEMNVGLVRLRCRRAFPHDSNQYKSSTALLLLIFVSVSFSLLSQAPVYLLVINKPLVFI